MTGFEWAAAATFISVCASSCAVLIHSIQQSRCTHINACCVSCDRDVPPAPDVTPVSTSNVEQTE
jgi:hypothetical protein